MTPTSSSRWVPFYFFQDLTQVNFLPEMYGDYVTLSFLCHDRGSYNSYSFIVRSDHQLVR